MSPLRALAALVILLAAGLAGCVQTPASLAPDAATLLSALNLTFNAPVVVDGVRIASEPSIKVAKDGTIFVSAPTGSVKYATRPTDILVEGDKGAMQSAIWVSRDNGSKWEFQQMAPLPYHDTLPGAGDSDLAIDSKGTVYMADQLGLADEVVSVSHDNGKSWEPASPLASGLPDVDRQWMWPDPTTAGTVYMVFDHNAVEVGVSKTTDEGKTWTYTPTTAPSTAPGPIVATSKTVAFATYDSAGILYTHSEDKGATWKTDTIKTDGKLFDHFPITVADPSGTIYVLWQETVSGGTATAYVYSKDAGKTFSPKVTAFTHPGKSLFLWAVTGSNGRLGLSWYEAPDPAGKFYEQAAILLGADSTTPQVTESRVSEKPALPYPPCESGTACTSGRELGDFQQCAVGPDGRLVVAYVTVVEASQGGHVTFAKILDGPSLFDESGPFSPWVV